MQHETKFPISGHHAFILAPHHFAHRIGQTVLQNIRMKAILRLLPCVVLIFFGIASAAQERPNIVVIHTDDQGHLPTSFSEEAVAFMDREKARELVQLHEVRLNEMMQSASTTGEERELLRIQRRAEGAAAKTMKSVKNQTSKLNQETDVEPLFFVAEGLDTDGSLVKNYRRGLDYAIDYFGNYGPFNIYLMGPENEQSVRDIYRKRAKSRAIPGITASEEEQVEEFLRQPNIIAEIDAVMAGDSTGGLTWSSPQRRVYEDVSTECHGKSQGSDREHMGSVARVSSRFSGCSQ